MAKFRKVHVSFWDDGFVETLTPEDKYFYLFLMTNPLSKECGIYHITKNKMSWYLGYNRETIDKLLKRMVEYGKIAWDETNSEVAIINRLKHIERLGKPVTDCLESELRIVKTKSFITMVGQFATKGELIDLYSKYGE